MFSTMIKVILILSSPIWLLLGYVGFYYGQNFWKTHSFENNENLSVLKVIHINDVHANYQPEEHVFINEKISRLAVIKNFVNQQKKSHAHTFFVSAGDAMEKGAIADHISKGLTTTDIYEKFGLDYLTLGNHDFAYSAESIVDFANRAARTTLSANVTFEPPCRAKHSLTPYMRWMASKLEFLESPAQFMILQTACLPGRFITE
ncbi:MAG: metallophosphoesterase [Bdellovibrionales bacterium]